MAKAMVKVEEDPFDCFGSSSDNDDESDSDGGDGDYEHASAASGDSGGEGDDGNGYVSGRRSRRTRGLVGKGGGGGGSGGGGGRRDEDCGVLSYHQGTESALLAHIRNAIDGLRAQPSSEGAGQAGDEAQKREEEWEGSATDVASAAVLEAVDDFCQTRHWMMHVGPEKGAILSHTLRGSAEEHVAAALAALAASRTSACSPPVGNGRVPFIGVELGTYCGYAAVLLGRILKAAALAASSRGQPCPTDFHLFTVEVNPDYASISREVVRLAGLDDVVSVIDVPLDVNVIDIEDAAAAAASDAVWKHEANMRQQLRGEIDAGRFDGEGAVPCSNLPKIDFLFIDHDKDMYLPDLQRLEREGLVRAGTTVVADNVIFARIEEYLIYVKKLAEEGIVETETIPARMEYADEDEDDEELLQDGASTDIFRDGIEVTQYLSSPIVGNESWLVRSAPRFAAMKLRGEKKPSVIGSNRPRPKTTGSVRMDVPF